MRLCRVVFTFDRGPEAQVLGRGEAAPTGALAVTLSADEGRQVFGVDLLPAARTPLCCYLGPVATGLLERLAARATRAGRRAVLDAFIDARRAVADACLPEDAAFELEALSCFSLQSGALFDGWVGMSATRFSRLVEEKDMSARSRCDEPPLRSCSPAWRPPASVAATSFSAVSPPALPARRS